MNYSGFNKVDMENGEGVRVSLFVSGCPFNCKGCFNQEARHLEAGLSFDETMLEEVLQALDKDYISGLSLLGGDPFHPHLREDVLRLCVTVKRRFPNKTIWFWTGFLFEDIQAEFPQFLNEIDVLIDGKFELKQLDRRLKWRGSANQRVIDVQQSIQSQQVILYCD